MKHFSILIATVLAVSLFIGCSDDSSSTPAATTYTLTITYLANFVVNSNDMCCDKPDFSHY